MKRILLLLAALLVPVASSAQILIKKGSTDVSAYVFLGDSTTGAPETGLTITTLDLQYVRYRVAPSTKADATALAATDSTHTDNACIEIDATDQPGIYRCDFPDAAFATGVPSVVVTVIATGVHPAHLEYQLVEFDPEVALATAAALDTVDNFVDTEVGDIQSRLPAALVGGRMDSSVGAMATDVITANAVATDASIEFRSILTGTADSGSTTTMVDAALTQADTDYWKDDAILFTSGNLAGQTRLVTAFNAATDTITFSPATTQAVATQNYAIVHNVAAAGASAPTAAENADAVWDELVADHVGAGSTGERVERLDIIASGGTGGLTNGRAALLDNLDAAVTTRLAPTVAGRTLDVTATGEAGLDLDNTAGTLSSAEIPNLDAAVTTRLAPTVAGRTLDVTVTGEAGIDLDNTVGTLAKTTDITGFNDLSAAAVNTEVDTAIADARLDELLAADSDIDGAAPPTVGSVFHEALTKTTGSFTFDQTTDSLEALRDNVGTAGAGLTGLAPVTLANGAHGGAAATMTLERVIVASTTTNEPGVKLTGNGNGAGLIATGGATGEGIDAAGNGVKAGIRATGGSSNGTGVLGVGQGSGSGLAGQGGSSGNGAAFVGLGGGHGMRLNDSGGAGNDLNFANNDVPLVGTPAGASVSADIAAIEGQTDDIGAAGAGLTAIPSTDIVKNATLSDFEFLMVLSSDHITPATGLTVAGQRSCDGAAFANLSGTIAEVGSGVYQFDAVAADTNCNIVTWKFNATGADTFYVTLRTRTP